MSEEQKAAALKFGFVELTNQITAIKHFLMSSATSVEDTAYLLDALNTLRKLAWHSCERGVAYQSNSYNCDEQLRAGGYGRWSDGKFAGQEATPDTTNRFRAASEMTALELAAMTIYANQVGTFFGDLDLLAAQSFEQAAHFCKVMHRKLIQA